jgi:hypothetical protein
MSKSRRSLRHRREHPRAKIGSGGRRLLAIDIFTKRGVTPPWEPGGAVARAQGFVRYPAGDRTSVLAAEPRLPRYASPTWIGLAISVAGWVLPRHAPMPDHDQFFADPLGQLRPDTPVMPEAFGHHHDGMRHRDQSDPKLGKRRGVCSCGVRHDGPPVRRRKNREGSTRIYPWPSDRDPWLQPSIKNRAEHEASTCDLVELANGTEFLVPSGHRHPKTGELVVPIDEPHRHVKQAKYLYTPGNTARRLGTNPMNIERGFEPSDGLFVVCLEGTLKGAAITEAGWPCIDSGSVTLWESEEEDYEGELVEGDFGESYWTGGTTVYNELAEFAERYLLDIPTAVVCDSDWFVNRLVKDQTDKVAKVLNECGARAVACAPPEGECYGWRHPLTGRDMRKKRGVDDWLGEHEPEKRHEALLGLVVRERVGDAPGLDQIEHHRLSGRSDGRRTTRDLLEAMGEDATPDRRAPYRRSALADRVGRDPRRIDDARDRAIEHGLLVPITEAEHVWVDGRWVTKAPEHLIDEAAMPVWGETTLREWLRQ